MSICARAVQQPDGSLLLALDPTNPNLATCPYVVETSSMSAWTELGNLSIENAQEISVAVGVLWAVAWTFRVLAKSLSPFESSENE